MAVTESAPQASRWFVCVIQEQRFNQYRASRGSPGDSWASFCVIILQFNDVLLVCMALKPLPGVKQQYKVTAKLDISGMRVCTCWVTFCPFCGSQLSDFVCCHIAIKITLQSILSIYMVVIASDKKVISTTFPFSLCNVSYPQLFISSLITRIHNFLGRFVCLISVCPPLYVVIVHLIWPFWLQKFSELCVFQQEAVGDGRLRPRCRHVANSTKRARVLWFWPIAPFCEDIMSSTKPEVHNILHSRQKRTCLDHR